MCTLINNLDKTELSAIDYGKILIRLEKSFKGTSSVCTDYGSWRFRHVQGGQYQGQQLEREHAGGESQDVARRSCTGQRSQ